MLSAFELGKFGVEKNYIDMALFVIFLTGFLYFKFFEKEHPYHAW